MRVRAPFNLFIFLIVQVELQVRHLWWQRWDMRSFVRQTEYTAEEWKEMMAELVADR